jgi:chromosome segregation ATPase
MSTAGKVLVVLVTLSLLIWIGLLSMVAQRNANWGQKLKQQEEEIAKLEISQTDVLARLAKLKNDIARAQESQDQALAVLRTEVADREEALTDTVEELERDKNQLKLQETALETAKAHGDHRNEEKKQTEADLDSWKEQVERLKGENAALMAQLSQLRTEFLTTMDDNRKLLQRFSR